MDEVIERMACSNKGNTSAKAAVDMALYDLWGKVLGQPLWRLLGGYRSSFETDLTISVGAIPQMVADSLAAVKDGYRILKVKVGKEGLSDLPRIAAIREAVGPDIAIRVDARELFGEAGDNLSQCQLQGRYVGEVTDVHKGRVFIRLDIGVNALAHECRDMRMPGRKDTVSFTVTRLDEKNGIAIGIITRIIKQNL